MRISCSTFSDTLVRDLLFHSWLTLRLMGATCKVHSHCCPRFLPQTHFLVLGFHRTPVTTTPHCRKPGFLSTQGVCHYFLLSGCPVCWGHPEKSECRATEAQFRCRGPNWNMDAFKQLRSIQVNGTHWGPSQSSVLIVYGELAILLSYCFFINTIKSTAIDDLMMKCEFYILQ